MKKTTWLCLLLIVAAWLIGGCGNTPKVDKIQPAHYPGWVQVKAGEEAEFAVPPQIAAEKEEFRTALLQKPDTDPLVRVLMKKDDALARHKGSVVLVSTDFKTVPWESGIHFARVTFQTLTSPVKMPRYGQNLGMDEKALKEFDDATRKGVQLAVSRDLPEGYRIECKNWKPMKTRIINGVEHLYVTYDEEISQNGQVLMTLRVRRWTFLNNDRIHVLIAAVNQADAAYWRDESRRISRIVNTLVIRPSLADSKDEGIWGKIQSLF